MDRRDTCGSCGGPAPPPSIRCFWCSTAYCVRCNGPKSAVGAQGPTKACGACVTNAAHAARAARPML